MDSQLVTYKITFPYDLAEDRAVGLFKALSGLYPPISKRSMKARKTIVLELMKTPEELHYLLSFHQDYQTIVQGILAAEIPGHGFEQVTNHQPRKWDFVKKFRRMSDVEPDVDRIPQLLASFGQLKEGEMILVQLVATPVGVFIDSENPGTYWMAGRIAVSSKDPHRIRGVEAAYKSLHAFSMHSFDRSLPHLLRRASDLVNKRSAEIADWPCTVNSKELAIMWGAPIGSPQIIGINYGRGQRLLAESAVPTGPITFGVSNCPGPKRNIGVAPSDLTKHQHVIGLQGSGKSTFMEHQMLQWMELGHGVTFLDPHGDSYRNLIDRIPKHRLEDVILLDLTSTENPVGFNVLEGDPERVTSQIMAVFDKLYDIHRLAITPNILRNAALTLAYNGLTLLDMSALLKPGAAGERFREQLSQNVPNEVVKNFWKEYDALKPEVAAQHIQPLLRRLQAFEVWPSLRGCLGQAKSGFSFTDVIAQNKIVLVNLSMGADFEEEGKLFGSLLLGKFLSAVRSRASLPPEQRKPYGLYVDEVHNFVHLPVSFATVLDEMRKFGLAFTMAHQRMEQLPVDLRGAALANARTKAYFKVQASDAVMLAREIPEITPDHILGLGAYEAIVRVVAGNADRRAATLKTPEPLPSLNHAHAVRIHSQRQYGRPLARVEEDIKARQKVVFEGPKKATIGARKS